MRALLVIAVLAGSLFLGHRYTPEHHADNPFTTLYYHLIPAPLTAPEHEVEGGESGEYEEHGEAEEHGVAEEHGASEEQGHAGGAAHEALLPVPLPGFLAWMDYRGATPPGGSPQTAVFNLQIFQIAAVLLVLVCLGGIPSYVRSGKGDRITKLFTGFAMWVRDEMVLPVMGKDNTRLFLPFFLCQFFFILFMNLLGLVPTSATATASIFVTAAMALTTLAAMIGCGMVVQGPIAFWKNLVPHVPLVLWPLMFFVEVLGLFVKPFALTVRLFANMNGGHMVVLSFMGLIFFLTKLWGAGGGWGMTPIGVGFAVFIMIIESFVAMLQAYIFTQLSIIFVQASLHPEH